MHNFLQLLFLLVVRWDTNTEARTSCSKWGVFILKLHKYYSRWTVQRDVQSPDEKKKRRESDRPKELLIQWSFLFKSALERPNKDFQHEGWPCNSISLHYLARRVSDCKAWGGITDSLNCEFWKASCCSGQKHYTTQEESALARSASKTFPLVQKLFVKTRLKSFRTLLIMRFFLQSFL